MAEILHRVSIAAPPSEVHDLIASDPHGDATRRLAESVIEMVSTPRRSGLSAVSPVQYGSYSA